MSVLLAGSMAVPVGAGEIEVMADGEGVPAVRYAGDDRFETAALVGTDDSPTGASYAGDEVILTRGDAFPDGLAGSLLAGRAEAPVLLTGTDSIPTAPGTRSSRSTRRRCTCSVGRSPSARP